MVAPMPSMGSAPQPGVRINIPELEKNNPSSPATSRLKFRKRIRLPHALNVLLSVLGKQISEINNKMWTKYSFAMLSIYNIRKTESRVSDYLQEYVFYCPENCPKFVVSSNKVSIWHNHEKILLLQICRVFLIRLYNGCHIYLFACFIEQEGSLFCRNKSPISNKFSSKTIF